ncbi:MAG: transcription-repair coupling factor [Endomicrobiia bacterium]
MNKIYVSGISEGAKAHFLSQYIIENDVKILLSIVEADDIDNIVQDLKTFLDNKDISVLKYPQDDQQERIITLSKILNNRRSIIVANKESIDINILSLDMLQQNSINFKVNNVYKHNVIMTQLSKIGYARETFVEEKGQFAIRGEIIDIWSSDSLQPVRLSFDFNTIETIKTFDTITQRSDKYLNDIKILPCTNFDSNTCLIDQLPKGSTIYIDYQINDESKYKDFNLVINSPLDKKAVHYDYQGFQGFQGDVNYFIDLLKEFKKENIEIKIYCSNMAEKQRVRDVFYENDWQYEDIPETILLPLWQGFYLKNKLAAVSTKEILYKRKQINFPKIKSGRRLEGIWEISAGDYVVHEKYGIGKYKGLKKITQEDKTAEYLCIEYKKGDKLYVPSDDFKVVEKYIGVEGVRPKLYSMDSFSWERVKSRARQEASEFAKELLNLYAQRCKIQRLPYSSANIWEKDLADSFVYEETEDQSKAIEDINNDFSKPYPMERLVCGDVGFGKTEVALRAAFKVVCQSKQVAVLVPTTVLAEQHYNTFINRLSAFPAKIEVLSRFQKVSQQKEIVRDIKKGNIDIIIGTHRLLQKDIEFKDLGLLIIDEEHRFGVKQKEKIKMLQNNIDMIMFSATPIPRTLSGALYGLRDLSLIETQPVGRLPIETTLSYYDKKLIKNVIEAELSRNGQVFYVYNRVETILNKSQEIKKLVPNINLAVIHGQLKPQEIEEVMWQFLNKEIDVLLATTIIESGIDIPTVNTMIIEDAQNFGLSQLHQLRGRIGRDKKKAYCYLLYKDKNLSDEAIKRLEAMKEFSDLGSGYKLALKDLEIRGAGGILSSKQHGFVRDVGYDMFSRLLEEEGRKVKGISTKQENKQVVTEIDLQVEAFIPQDYIEDEDIRILFYRKISNIMKEEEIINIENELKDRFGKLPEPVNNLFEVSKIKIKSTKLHMERLSEDKKYIYIYFLQDADFNNIDIMSFINDHKHLVEFNRTNSFSFKLIKTDVNKWNFLNTFLNNFKKYIRKKEKI